MSFLAYERSTLERFLPNLDAALAEHSLESLERAGGPAIELFRKHGGPGLLVPKELGGLGATMSEAIRVQRALGARAPSLAVATTMHHLTVMVIVEYSLYGASGTKMMRNVVEQRHLLASAFAEGKSGANVLDATMRAIPVEGGYRLTGSKKPCSLSHSMDMAMVGVALPLRPGLRGIGMVASDAPGIQRKPFWTTNILAGAESDEVIFEDVFIPEEDMLVPETDDSLGIVDDAETGGVSWFEVLVSGAYLGIASALVERALLASKPNAGRDHEYVALAIELEGAANTLEGMAQRLTNDGFGVETLCQTLLGRYSVQRAIERATTQAVEILGGIAFVRSPEVAYLLAASRALSLHPLPRLSVGDMLMEHLKG